MLSLAPLAPWLPRVFAALILALLFRADRFWTALASLFPSERQGPLARRGMLRRAMLRARRESLRARKPASKPNCQPRQSTRALVLDSLGCLVAGLSSVHLRVCGCTSLAALACSWSSVTCLFAILVVLAEVVCCFTKSLLSPKTRSQQLWLPVIRVIVAMSLFAALFVGDWSSSLEALGSLAARVDFDWLCLAVLDACVILCALACLDGIAEWAVAVFRSAAESVRSIAELAHRCTTAPCVRPVKNALECLADWVAARCLRRRSPPSRSISRCSLLVVVIASGCSARPVSTEDDRSSDSTSPSLTLIIPIASCAVLVLAVVTVIIIKAYPNQDDQVPSAQFEVGDQDPTVDWTTLSARFGVEVTELRRYEDGDFSASVKTYTSDKGVPKVDLSGEQQAAVLYAFRTKDHFLFELSRSKAPRQRADAAAAAADSSGSKSFADSAFQTHYVDKRNVVENLHGFIVSQWQDFQLAAMGSQASGTKPVPARGEHPGDKSISAQSLAPLSKLASAEQAASHESSSSISAATAVTPKETISLKLACYSALIQSSMYGKSRLIYELAKSKMFVVYSCIRLPSTSSDSQSPFPKANDSDRDFLRAAVHDKSCDAEARFLAFYIAWLQEFDNWLASARDHAATAAGGLSSSAAPPSATKSVDSTSKTADSATLSKGTLLVSESSDESTATTASPSAATTAQPTGPPVPPESVTSSSALPSAETAQPVLSGARAPATEKSRPSSKSAASSAASASARSTSASAASQPYPSESSAASQESLNYLAWFMFQQDENTRGRVLTLASRISQLLSSLFGRDLITSVPQERVVELLQPCINLKTLFNRLNQHRTLLVLALDEASSLVETPPHLQRPLLVYARRALRFAQVELKAPIFLLLTDTLAKLSNFLPPIVLIPSARTIPVAVMDLHPPFVHISTTDIFADARNPTWDIALREGKSMPEFKIDLLKLGRAGFGCYLREMPLTHFLSFLSAKLCAGDPEVIFAERNMSLDRLESSLAVMASITALDIAPATRVASDLVASRMATCLAVSQDRHAMLVAYISEPILSLVARDLFLKFQHTILSDMITIVAHGFVAPGPIGEHVAEILIQLAIGTQRNLHTFSAQFDNAQQDVFKPLRSVLANLLQTEVLEQVMRGMHMENYEPFIGLTHFIPCTYDLEHSHLEKFLDRSAGIRCKDCQRGMDIVIPLLYVKQDLAGPGDRCFISYWSIQVKNRNHDGMSDAHVREKLRDSNCFKMTARGPLDVPYLTMHLSLRGQSSFQRVLPADSARDQHQVCVRCQGLEQIPLLSPDQGINQDSTSHLCGLISDLIVTRNDIWTMVPKMFHELAFGMHPLVYQPVDPLAGDKLCQGITKKGKPCRLDATVDSRFCRFHSKPAATDTERK